MNTDRIWLLIGRKLAKEASAEELQELEQLLRSHPDVHFPFQILSDSWASTQSDEEDETTVAYSRHLDRMQQQGLPSLDQVSGDKDDTGFLLEGSRRRLTSRSLVISICTFSLALITVWWFMRPPQEKSADASQPAAVISEVSTKFGSRSEVHLPDGTHVWLNAGSKLTYDENFNKTLREVKLTGEAFFDVARNQSKPFVIHVSNVDIKVLGTRFNVKSYPGEAITEASLIHGKIEVSVKSRDQEKFILHPNEKIVVKNDSVAIAKPASAEPATHQLPEPVIAIQHLTYQQKDSVILETSWVDNKLIFQDESFEDLAKKMERWYGVSIQFKDRSLQQERFNGSFTTETVAQALSALKIAEPFNFRIDHNIITISR